MESLKKYLKLLCCVFITLFMFGFGGEKVLADEPLATFRAKEGVRWINIDNPYIWWSTVKTINGGSANGKYVFCLDSHKKIFTIDDMEYAENLARDYNDNYKSYIGRILNKAYKLGLGNGENSHTITIGGEDYSISEVDLYGVAQSAVWFAAHGRTSIQEDGFSQKYEEWIDEAGKESRKEIFDYLIATDNFSYDLLLSSDGNAAMTVDGNYLVSGEYTVVSNIPANLTATVTGGEWSTDGENWSSNSNTVSNGQKIRLRALKPVDGEVKVTLKVKSASFVTDYSINTYAPKDNNTATSIYQNLVYSTEEYDFKEAEVTAIGNYTEKGTVKIRKVDSNTGNPVGGAYLSLIRKDSQNSSSEDIIDLVISKSSSQSDGGWITYSDLKPGYYCLTEEKAPKGYVLNDNDACGTLNDNGTLELSKSDKKQRVKYRKVDAEGNGISGVRVEIHDYVEELTLGKENVKYLCGISNGQGYLVTACPEADPSNSNYDSRIISPDSNGTFPMSVHENDVEAVLAINEVFKDGFYNPHMSLDDTTADFGFGDIYNPETGEEVFGFGYGHIPATKFLTFDGEIGIDDYVTVTIINERYLNISKIDTGTGKEISGAKMILWDLSIEDKSIDIENSYEMADSWISDGTPHTFIGIIPGHKYRLEETVAPVIVDANGKENKYAKLATFIEFEVNENGKVTLHTVDQHATVPESYNYLIIGNDLIVNPPNTGISLLNTIAIGGLLVFVGYEAIKIYRRRTA